MKILLIVLLLFTQKIHSYEKMVSPEPYAGEVAPINDGRGEWVVCVDSAPVRGGPGVSRAVQYTLPRGTIVNVREKAAWTSDGWFMIAPALWVSALDVCRK